MDIHLKNVTYVYPGRVQPALRDVTFDVAAGELVGLIGLNGAGKTTVGNLVAGFIPHFFHGTLQGEVHVGGVDVRSSTIAQLATTVGYVFAQAAQQFSGTAMTVYDEIAFGPENLGLDRAVTRQRVAESIETLRIADLADRSPWEISGGQQQRVALASVLAMRPRILVLDEPTSQLDPLGTREVFAAIRDLWHQGMTVVMIEHKLDLLAEVATRLIHLDHGEIVADGAPAAVLQSPALAEHGLEPPIALQVGRRLGLDPPPLTLEQVVLRLGGGPDGRDRGT